MATGTAAILPARAVAAQTSRAIGGPVTIEVFPALAVS